MIYEKVKNLVRPPDRSSRRMRLLLVLSIVTSVLLVPWAGVVRAVPPGKTVDYVRSASSRVIFEGKTHGDAGFKCTDCHPKIFPTKKSETLGMGEMNAGKSCGACHNGRDAFATNDPFECTRCHKP